MQTHMPKWLWFFLIIIAFSFLTPLIEPLKSAPSVVVCVLFGALILFPGKDARRPRLIKFLPFFWALEFLSAAALLVLQRKPDLLPEELRDQSVFLVIATLIWTPILAWHFFRKTKYFILLFVLVALVNVANFAWQLAVSSAHLDDGFQLLATLILTVYIWKKFRTDTDLEIN